MHSEQNTLAWLRKSIGLTQDQMAQLLGVDRTSLARYENGERNPGSLGRSRITRALVCLAAAKKLPEFPPEDPLPDQAYQKWEIEKVKGLERKKIQKQTKLMFLEEAIGIMMIQKRWCTLMEEDLSLFRRDIFKNLVDKLEIEWDTINYKNLTTEILILKKEIQLLDGQILILSEF